MINIKYENNIKKICLFGIVLISRYRVVYKHFNGIDFCRYTYKIFNFVAWKTHSIVECVSDINLNNDSTVETLCGAGHMSLDIANTIINDSDIFDKIKRLSYGLDSNSKKRLFVLISRLRKHYFDPNNVIYDLTPYEKAEFAKIKADFWPNVFEIKNLNNESIYCYNGYYLPINYFEVGIFYHKHGMHIFNDKTLEKIKRKNIIDVGGFVGDSAIVLQEFTDKNIYSFEALSNNYKLMLKTIELNDSNKIIPVNNGLGSKNERLPISIQANGSSMVHIENCETENVEIITLDEFVKKNKIEVGFIKVDIEGFEQEFLKGALATIKEQKPAMLISIYHNSNDFFNIKPFIESLDLGYKFHIFKPLDTFSFHVETSLYCEVL
ncbi:FkbM family methyltransferase [Campylobacter volucris]|uniref:FkbM family methyltransferase n=1 Tax=Campylobacter volucris TaxID=1031542 RepID=UPI00189C705C|nr:FkbM family methyltransferase [Campylobacter volucris]MBF7047537.1 FkbM family methyltransferase [Campylobacter volucris]